MGSDVAKKRKVEELWAEMNATASVDLKPKTQAKDTGKKKKGKKSKERRKAKRDQVSAVSSVYCEAWLIARHR